MSELQTQADTQIKPPLRHNYPRLKLNNNPLREKRREKGRKRGTLTLTDTDSQREAGWEKRHVKTGKNKKRKRIIKSMEELFHSHHSNPGLETAIVAIMVCGVLRTRNQFVTKNNIKAGK